MRARPIVAIDGPSGAGKSTVARGIARALSFALIDTGALYRTVAWLAEGADVDWQSGAQLADLIAPHHFEFDAEGGLFVDGDAIGDRIRTPKISEGASIVSRHDRVRSELLAIQRRLGADGGVVLEGRDIGTVVFPDAEFKFFLVASPAVRARRRYEELLARGTEVELADVERDLRLRDASDTERTNSPLRQATDAIEIDCDQLDAEQVVTRMLDHIETKNSLTS